MPETKKDEGSWGCSVFIQPDMEKIAKKWKEVEQIPSVGGKGWSTDDGYFIKHMIDGHFQANYPGNYELGVFPTLENAQIRLCGNRSLSAVPRKGPR